MIFFIIPTAKSCAVKDIFLSMIMECRLIFSLAMVLKIIIVINRYYGVTRIESSNGFTYKTQIHINGIYLVGLYPKEETAAVAYNKAVDLAKKNGISKNFQMNYVEEYSPREYAEIYNNIKLSEKYLDYLQRLNLI